MTRKIQLLIIEEHAAVRNALEVRMLSSNNINVVAATRDIDEWQSGVYKLRPDVVLIGLRSSRSRRLSPTIRAISDFRHQNIAVIILAAFADEVERELVFQAGAARYLLKDINSTQLIAAIEDVAAEALF